jgi:hypothetical protein
LITASVTYSYTFMRDLEGRLTYRHTQRSSPSPTTDVATTGSGTAKSDAILIVLRHEVKVLP